MTTAADGVSSVQSQARSGIDFGQLARDLGQSGHWIVVLAYGLVYLPVFIVLAEGPWRTEQDGHGSLILIITAFLLMFQAPALRDSKGTPAPIMGTLALLGGAFFLALGQSQGHSFFSAGSQIPVLAGLILYYRGWKGLWVCWFPVFFLIFAVPMPGWVLDGFTQAAKLQIAYEATELLYALGYPIAQNGVTITIGGYELLVKDACAGLNSLYGLLSVGLFYVYATRDAGLFRNTVLFLFIVPAAILANFIRVLSISLITYHFGEAAGEGILHDLSGIVLFVIALILFLILDGIFVLFDQLKRRVWSKKGESHA